MEEEGAVSGDGGFGRWKEPLLLGGSTSGWGRGPVGGQGGQ